MRRGALVVLVSIVLGCGGGDGAAPAATTTSTAPPTTLISFTGWEAATDAVCAQHGPALEQYIASMGEPATIEAAVASIQGLLTLNRQFTDAMRAIPVPDDRRVDVRRTYHLWTTTDGLLDEAVAQLGRGDFAAFQLTLAEYDERFADAGDLLNSFDVPNCNGPT